MPWLVILFVVTETSASMADRDEILARHKTEKKDLQGKSAWGSEKRILINITSFVRRKACNLMTVVIPKPIYVH